MAQSPKIDQEYLGQVIDSLSAHVDKRVRSAKTGQRTARSLDNLVNAAWVAGRPYYMRRPEDLEIVGLKSTQRTKYVSINKSLDVHRTVKSIMAYDIDCEAAPRTADPEDTARANMAQAIAKSLIQNSDLSGVYDRVLDDCGVCGYGLIRPWWDPTLGSLQPIFGAVPCPQCNGTRVLPGPMGSLACTLCGSQGLLSAEAPPPGHVMELLRREPAGDVAFQVFHPNNVYLDPEADVLEEVQYATLRNRMPAAKAWLLYGREAGISEAELQSNSSDPYREIEVSAYSNYGGRVDRDYVVLWEHWEKPCEEFPLGLKAVMCGNLILEAGPLPDVSDVAQLPLFFFPMYRVPGLLYPLGTVDLVLSLVQNYNNQLSVNAARAYLSAKTRMMIPREAGHVLDDKTGNVLYNDRPGRNKPEVFGLAPFPAEANGMLEIFDEAIKSLSGASDVARGQFQNGADSARAMAWLDERARGVVAPTMRLQNRAVERVLQYGIDLAAVKYDDGRLISFVGQGGAPELHAFRAGDCGAGSDVRLSVIRNQGRSRTVLMDELDKALAAGAITPEEYRSLGDSGDMGPPAKKRAVHRNKAMNEWKTLKEFGWIPPAIKYQNHEEHLDTHQMDLANAQVSLQADDPQILAMIDHCDQHVRMRAQEQFELQSAIDTAAAEYGRINAGAAANQPQGTQDTAAAMGAEPVPTQAPGAPGSQPSLDTAAQTARSFDQQPVTPGASQ